jgi:hypothetical protein
MTDMRYQQWLLLGTWPVENQRRVILKSKGPHLIDITTDESIVNEIVAKVLDSSWTIEEFSEYLNQKGLSA